LVAIKERLALHEPKIRDIPTVEMQEIESVIDEPHLTPAVGRLSVGEARQSPLVDPAEFAVDIGGLHVEACERRDRAWIFLGPVEPGPGQQLCTALSMRAAIR
jgi:hypothetical protein